METVKNYQYINPGVTQLSFDIKRMEDIYRQRGGTADEPHRHDYYTLLLIKQATGKHIIDFQAYPLAAKQVYFVSPGQVHQLIEQEASIGCVLTFNQQFLIENGIDACFLEDINLFQDYGTSPPLIVNDQQEKELFAFSESIFHWKASNGKFKDQAIAALLKLMLITCNNICLVGREDNPQQVQAGLSILRTFKQLVEQNYKQEHQVNFYADHLFVTPDHLNRTIKSLLGKTAKAYIQNRILIAAKRQLHFTANPAKEIAYELGFTDAAYFSHFFKKMSGQSVTDFRTTD